MRLQAIICLFLCAVLLTQSLSAFETDQFNLPTAPLADIGDEVSEYTEENLREALGKVNAEILAHRNCLENRGKNCGSAEKERLRLNYLRSEQAVARAVFNLLGAGIIPSTKSGTWMNSHKFKAQPARYKSSYTDSIYRVVPTNYLTVSPTVKLYGVHFGTDKIAHFFQQGHTYYAKSRRAVEKGLPESEAAKKAIRWGKISEQTYFGTFVSGVYANADLAANYAGMKFYQGLTREIKIGEIVRPPIVQLKNGVWTINENIKLLREILLKPFITDHFNEALNSSKYSFFLRPFVRRTVRKKACGEWRAAFPALTQADFADISQKLKLWHGEDYGFSESENFVTIANTCF